MSSVRRTGSPQPRATPWDRCVTIGQSERLRASCSEPFRLEYTGSTVPGLRFAPPWAEGFPLLRARERGPILSAHFRRFSVTFPVFSLAFRGESHHHFSCSRLLPPGPTRRRI